MASKTCSFLFFSDQAHAASTYNELLHSLRKRALPSTPLLHAFANQRLCDVIGEGHGILEWAHLKASGADGGRDPMINALIPSIAQLGSLVWKSQQDPSIFSDGGSNLIVGQCSGLILACGAAAASDANHLVELSAEILRIIARVTRFAVRRSWEIEDEPGASWAHAIQLTRAECLAALEECPDHARMAPHKRAYASFQVDGWCTISGPPSTLRLLLSGVFKDTTRRELPIFAAYHAEHLREPHYDELLGHSTLLDIPISPGVQVLSSSTGKPLDGSSLRNVLLQALRDILQQPSSLTRVLETTVYQLKQAASPPILHNFGPAAQCNAFVHRLEAAGLRVTISPALGQGRHRRSGDNDDDETDEEEDDDDNDEDLIAITGYSGRFPGAESCEELWNLLCDGRIISGEMPLERVADGFDGPLPRGCFLERAGQFDASFFGMSRRAARQTDPAHRLLLHVTQESLDMAGYTATASGTTCRVGTFVGQATDDWREHNMDPLDAYYVTGGLRAFGPGRLNHFFGWDGPSLSVDTACSSSGVALDLAVQALRGRKCDMAVAGGVSIVTGGADVGMCAGLGSGGFLGAPSTGPGPGTACKTFGAAADGYTRGEAVAVVILKRLSDARRCRDVMHGVIRGVATNHSTGTSPITRPSVAAQVSLLRQVLHESKRSPADVSYVEMHGSGTQAGDRAEMEAVAAVFGGGNNRHDDGRRTNNPLRVGSIKANIGHSEGAAGITAVVKALLVLRHSRVPPNVGLGVGGVLNPLFPPLDDLRIRINTEKEQLVSRRGRNTVLVNCFGAAGGNTSIVIEGVKQKSRSRSTPRAEEEEGEGRQRPHVVTLSAKSRPGLHENKRRLLNFLERHASTIRVADLSYTTCARRHHHHRFRSAYVAHSVAEVMAKLRQDIIDNESLPGGPPPASSYSSSSSSISSSSSSPQSVVFVFSGQGSKVAGAAQTLFDSCSSSSVFRQALEDYSRLGETLGFPGILQLLTSTGTEQPLGGVGGPEKMSPTDVSLEQVALVVLELALGRMWQSWGIRPGAVLGHSLGEYAALNTAGILSAADTIWLVGRRARLLEDTCREGAAGRMLAVFSDEARLIPFLAGSGTTPNTMEVACRNTPHQTVVAGPGNEILALKDRLGRQQGIKSVLLRTPYAFHSSQTDGMLDQLRSSATGLQQSFVSQPRVRFVSTVTGSLVESCPSWPDYLVQHTRRPVCFPAAIKSAMALSPSGRKTLFLALGPTPACRDMVMTNAADAAAAAGSDGRADVLDATLAGDNGGLDAMAHSLAKAYSSGIDVDWVQYHADFDQDNNKNGRAALLDHLPSYAFDLEDFWIPLAQRPLSPLLPRRPPPSPPTDSPLIHTLDKGHGNDTGRRTIYTSHLEQEPFRSLILGHAIRGKAMCPAGALVDMAFAVVLRLLGGQADLCHIDLRSLRFKSPITLCQDDDAVVPPPSRRVVVLKTAVEQQQQQQRPGTDAEAEFAVSFFSGGEYGTRLHASCVLQRRRDDSGSDGRGVTTDKLLRGVSLMMNLRDSRGIDVNHFTQSMIYKLWAAFLMQYSTQYHVLQELWMGSAGYQAAGIISVPTPQGGEQPSSSSFVADPLWLDGVMQVAGFVVNMNTETNVGAAAAPGAGGHILTECRGISFRERPQYDMPYACYAHGCRDSETEDIIMSVLVFDEQHGMRLIAAVDGMRFHKLAGKPSRSSTSRSSGINNSNNMDINNISSIANHATTAASTLPRYTASRSHNVPETPPDSSGGEYDQVATPNTTTTTSTTSTTSNTANLGRCDAGTADRGAVLRTVIQILVKETHSDPSAVGDHTPLADIGIDSLLMTSVANGLRAGLGVQIPLLALMETQTVGDVAALCCSLLMESNTGVLSRHKTDGPGPDVEATSHGEAGGTTANSEYQAVSTSLGQVPDAPVIASSSSSAFSSRAVLLQRHGCGENTLFLLPDASGSSAIYTGLPPSLSAHTDTTIFALESPFHGMDNLPDCSMQEYCSFFVDAIRRVQPTGPYMLGGWSIGGRFAYECAAQLARQGHALRGLLLIESYPRHAPHLAAGPDGVCVEHLEATGFFEWPGRPTAVPDWQKRHMLYCILMNSLYTPSPLRADGNDGIKVPLELVWSAQGDFSLFPAKVLQSKLEMVTFARGKTKKRANASGAWLKELRSMTEAARQSDEWAHLSGAHVQSHIVQGDHFDIMLPRVRGDLAQVLENTMQRFFYSSI